jgi:hypothetical protein
MIGAKTGFEIVPLTEVPTKKAKSKKDKAQRQAAVTAPKRHLAAARKTR